MTKNGGYPWQHQQNKSGRPNLTVLLFVGSSDSTVERDPSLEYDQSGKVVCGESVVKADALINN